MKPCVVPAKPEFSISVRELVEFVLRTGDLGGERDFVSPARAAEGTRGHQRIQRSRPAGYVSEQIVTCQLETPAFILRIKGRLDGVLPTAQGALIEEIKTIQGFWDGAANPLHWAQGKVYACLYAEEHSVSRVEIQLTYLELETGKITAFRQVCAREELKAFFEQVTGVYLQWLQHYHEWRQMRDQSIRAAEFPFTEYRPGQRAMAVGVYRSLARGGTLFVEAPTGIGKTISVLFPAIKALEKGHFSQFFYLTAKTSGRMAAEKALAELRRAGAHLRSVTLTAKEKICFNDGQSCDAQTCPYARGYYDRIKSALRAALPLEQLARPVIEQVARQHGVCPHELSLDLIPWIEVIICDYNYAFDPRVRLKRYFSDETGDISLLVDEAHNLVDRAREMYSAELTKPELLEAKRAVQAPLPPCAKLLSQMSRRLKAGDNAIAAEQAEYAGTLFADMAPVSASAKVTPELPAELLALMRVFLKEAERWLAQNQPADYRQTLLDIYFRILGFVRAAELYDERFVTIWDFKPTPRVRLFCLDPSRLIRQTNQQARSTVFFSATLTPMDYYRDMLGGQAGDASLRLASPFPPENLCVLVQDRIRTNWKDREFSRHQVARAIAALVGEKTGNYLVYFPSYQYLHEVRERFAELRTNCRILAQKPGMSEPEREAFLAKFHESAEETLVGFAVMGGVFGEGIDLVGDCLIGAIIVGVGFPQVCLERELMRDFFERSRGHGFDYAYTFPGMNRVLQAVGRVIRSDTDRGAVLLVDRRFSQPRHRALFPDWWTPRPVRSESDIAAQLKQFWKPPVRMDITILK